MAVKLPSSAPRGPPDTAQSTRTQFDGSDDRSNFAMAAVPPLPPDSAPGISPIYSTRDNVQRRVTPEIWLDLCRTLPLWDYEIEQLLSGNDYSMQALSFLDLSKQRTRKYFDAADTDESELLRCWP